MRKSFIIAVLILWATYLGTHVWFNASYVFRNVTSSDLGSGDVTADTEYETWVDGMSQLSPETPVIVHPCPDLPDGNWQTFIIRLDDDVIEYWCFVDNEMNASWDNEAWFQY